MKIKVELEFDEKDLGPKWMNSDNLGLLLYSDTKTRKDLLKVNSFQEMKKEVCSWKYPGGTSCDIDLEDFGYYAGQVKYCCFCSLPVLHIEPDEEHN